MLANIKKSCKTLREPKISKDSTSQRASKSHYWFKSYGDFAEWVGFAHWWSCIGKGLHLQPAQQTCFLE